MVKIQIISDMHLQNYKGISGFLPSKDAEVIIFAGDIAGSPAQAEKFFTNLRTDTDALFLYVLGNHEYFHQIFSNAVKKYKKALESISGMYLLDKQSYKYKDIIFSGGTLWTDYDKERGIAAALYGMIDFEYIYKRKRILIDPYDLIKEHRKQVEFFKTRRCSTDEKHIFITHHMPSFSLIQPEYRNSTLNGAFAVDLDDVILKHQPDFWVCGHTHSQFQTQILNTSIICNPIGYPRENLSFKEITVIF